MNQSYQEAALAEARNLGEGTAEFHRQQQAILAGSLNAGVGSRIQDNFAIQPRLGSTFKAAAQDMMIGNK